MVWGLNFLRLLRYTFYEAYFEQDDPAGLAAYLLESFSPQQIFADLADPNTIFFIAYRSGKAVGYARLLGNSTLAMVTLESGRRRLLAR